MSYLELARKLIGESAATAAPAAPDRTSAPDLPTSPTAPIEDAPIAEAREQIGAVLIRSPRFGEVWIALDPCMAPTLEAEERARQDPRPVLHVEDVVRLRGKPEAAVRAVLETLRAFPGARVKS